MMKIKMGKITILIILIFLIGLIYGCSSSNVTGNANKDTKVTVFKSPSCGCCVGYIAELERNGFDVEIVETTDMTSIKQRYGIPRNMESCHTTVMGDYFVEGHVPIEAVEKLLEEKPDINGIALPNMPAGSPGMPGIKRMPFRIYSLSNGQVSEFATI
tara:strand:- start:664 stop:1137 length:474 start_codon:yes stop_codon:yes gene_type:complete